MTTRTFLNTVIRQKALICQLLANENEALLIRRNSSYLIYLGLDCADRVRRLHEECRRFAPQSLDENIPAADKLKARKNPDSNKNSWAHICIPGGVMFPVLFSVAETALLAHDVNSERRGLWWLNRSPLRPCACMSGEKWRRTATPEKTRERIFCHLLYMY